MGSAKGQVMVRETSGACYWKPAKVKISPEIISKSLNVNPNVNGCVTLLQEKSQPRQVGSGPRR